MTVSHFFPLSSVISFEIRRGICVFRKGLLVEKIVLEHQGVSQSINKVLDRAPGRIIHTREASKAAATILEKDALN
jgi:hypothetical protein